MDNTNNPVQQALPVPSIPENQPIGNVKYKSNILLVLGVLFIILIVGTGSYFWGNKFTNSSISQIPPASITNKTTPLEQTKHILVIERLGTTSNYFLFNEDGTPYKQLSLERHSGRASSGRISPDRKYFTYISYETKEAAGCALKNPPDCPPNTYGLRIKNLDTGQENDIVKPSENSTSYTYWSPNSQYVAYSQGNATFFYNPSSKISTQISSFNSNYSISWMSDNSGLYLSDGVAVYFYNFSSKQLQKITNGNFAQTTYDKKYLVVSYQYNDGVYLVNNDGSQKKITEKHFGGILNNTHKLVYSQFIQAHPGAQNPSPDDKFSLFLYDLDSNQEKQILSSNGTNYFLSADGSKISYQDYLAPEQGKLYLLDINSGAKTKFGSGEETGQVIDWQ